MKYFLLLLLFLVSCGDSTTNSTNDTTSDSDTQTTNNPFSSEGSSETSTATEDKDNTTQTSISGKVQYYDDDISLVKICFINPKGEVETT